MEDIQRYYPDKARVVNIGTTEEGRPIKGIKIGSGVHRNDKRIVWIDGGIHAREWAAVHTVIYVIDRVCCTKITPKSSFSIETVPFLALCLARSTAPEPE
ncbi:hypothetical protein ANCCAN_30275 [Ancylostoma caninum]|uniref:Peptidase M14 domain-containing protein n=1 Tax=Ancylostoma caninum TaxID=29170 RepID=A0A368EWL9_ANCCA|nr:hypothetical protein ANCCAN_30275 [Ancylostoma caninum]